jgi:tetratricopeptide (TPR) repeat protein
MRSMTALLLLALAIAAPSARPSLAGDMPPALATGYGNGVHAYNEGDYQCSYDELSRVIEAGSNDPRVFYFRGLAALKLGRMDEADADFQQGANLEADGVGGRAVSRALERIQGCDRLKLEQFRSQARVAAVHRDREAIRQRYSDIYEAEPEVLRRRRPEPVEPVPAPAAKETEPRADAEAPAEETAEESVEEPAAEPAAEPADEATDEPADTSDPFGDAPATEKETPAEDNAL